MPALILFPPPQEHVAGDAPVRFQARLHVSPDLGAMCSVLYNNSINNVAVRIVVPHAADTSSNPTPCRLNPSLFLSFVQIWRSEMLQFAHEIVLINISKVAYWFVPLMCIRRS
jgi:hypothetical protein